MIIFANMKMSFQIEYRAPFGQSMHLCVTYYNAEMHRRVHDLLMHTDDGNTWEVETSSMVLSHFPVITGNAGTTSLHSATYCLFGHTHQTVDFTEGLPFACHVGVDSHGLKPVPLDDIMMELRQHCLEMRVFRKEETSGEDAVPSEIFS